MRCPNCDQTEMIPGKIVVRKRLTSFLFFGLGWSHLEWEDADGRHEILEHGDHFLASRCPACEAILADPKKTQESKELANQVSNHS